MPVRNGGMYLEAAVSSILSQTLRDFEFIIVDDGSTDGTVPLLATLAETDGRIRLFSSGGSGIVAALNLGIQNANAELIARMDADDIALPERLELQLALMRGNPQIIAAGGAALLIDQDGQPKGRFDVPTDASEISEALKIRNPFVHPSMMFRRLAVIKAGLYRAGCTHAEDYDLWLRLQETGSLANLPEPLIKFRVHRGQISHQRRLLQRAATAVARQAAQRRRRGMDEGSDLSKPLQEALCAFLVNCASQPDPLELANAKDISVMLRAAHLGLDRALADLLAGRIRRETSMPKAWLLPFQLAFSRMKRQGR